MLNAQITALLNAQREENEELKDELDDLEDIKEDYLKIIQDQDKELKLLKSLLAHYLIVETIEGGTE